MLEYVVGFLFSEDLEHVALIRKNKPEWQRGLLNGVGGKIEPGERPHDAMVREFREETNAEILKWTPLCTLLPNDGIDTIVYTQIHFFYAVGDAALASPTDEKVSWYYVYDLRNWPILPNLHWLIPMALTNINRPECREIGTLVFK